MLAFFVVYFSLIALYPNAPYMAAMLDNEKTLVGAFLGLVTGRALQRAQDAAQRTQTPSPPTTQGAPDNAQK